MIFFQASDNLKVPKSSYSGFSSPTPEGAPGVMNITVGLLSVTHTNYYGNTMEDLLPSSETLFQTAVYQQQYGKIREFSQGDQ